MNEGNPKNKHSLLNIYIPNINMIKKTTRKLIEKLHKKRMSWKTYAKKRWLGTLLANEKIIIQLVKFFKLIYMKKEKTYEKSVSTWKKKIIK